jgi:hypothetical protein
MQKDFIAWHARCLVMYDCAGNSSDGPTSSQLVKEITMKQLNKIVAGLALAAAGGMASTAAMAAPTCTGCDFANGPNNVYLGSYDPTFGESGSFTHRAIPDGAFSDTWWFDLSPGGQAAINAVFIPTFEVSGFSVQLFGPGSATCSAINTACTGPFTPGALITTGVTDPNFVSNIEFTALPAGRYSFVVSGTADAGGNPQHVYSGNLTTDLPEPGTLALAGVALLAFGAARRRKSA